MGLCSLDYVSEPLLPLPIVNIWSTSRYWGMEKRERAIHRLHCIDHGWFGSEYTAYYAAVIMGSAHIGTEHAEA